ncbi:MAG TPA: hypothetical protein DFS52_06750 [Myxococcales bacterium]|nr:hypothetical protein [Myxococcales bacterium]
MAREYSAESMVNLPNTTAARAVALGEAIITVADGVTLPPVLERHRESTRSELAALKAVLRPTKPDDDAKAYELDRQLDAAWSGLFDVVTGWTKLPPAIPQSAKAKTLHALLFGDGLRFTLFDHRTEWAQSETLLKILSEEQNAALVRDLGAQSLVEAVREAHRLYGQRLGITSVRAPDEKPELRSRSLSFSRALRRFVLQVAAYGESGEPDSEQLADKLLRPLVEWRSPRPSPKPSPTPEVVPTSD